MALLDVENNCIIAGKNKDARIYPASMTKVMTLIVAVEHLQDLSQTFTMTADIVDPLFREGASRAGFEAGDTVNMEDMLYGLILPSGADAAVGLAIMTAGSEDNFAVLMNEKCEELGLQNTHFMNASGLHNENQYTTPVEMAMIVRRSYQSTSILLHRLLLIRKEYCLPALCLAECTGQKCRMSRFRQERPDIHRKRATAL